MKTTQKTHNKKIWIISVASLAIIIGGLVTYAVLAQGGNFSLPGQEPSQTDNKANDSDSDIENTTNTPDKETPPNTDQPAPSETDESSGLRIIPVVSSATVDGNVVYIRGGTNTPEVSGSCYAILEGPNNIRIQKDTTLLPSANTSDCKTIMIQKSELTVGEWSATLNFVSDSAKGTSSAETFTIN